MKKPNWLKDSIAKADGYYSTKGEKLKSAKLSEEQIAEWNGVTVKKVPFVQNPVSEPVVEEVVEEEVEVSAEPKSVLDKMRAKLSS